MGLLARILGKGQVNQPDPRQTLAPFPWQFVPTELRLTFDEQLSLSAVWGCIRVISEPIAASPWSVFVRNNGLGREVLHDDPIAWLLNERPNPETTAQALKEGLMVQALSIGDSYAEIEYNRGGVPCGLWPLLTIRMRPERRADGALVYKYHEHDGRIIELDPRQVLHIRGLSLNGMFGETAITHAARAIATGVAAEKFAGSYYANGANPSGILYGDKSLSDQGWKRLRSDWLKRKGPKNAHTVPILEEGFKYQTIGSNAEESQVIPARVFTVEEVARAFGVPLVKLGVPQAATGYGTNVAQLNLAFTRDTLVPWKIRVEQEVNYKLFPQRAPWRKAECDLSWLTLGDAKERASSDKVRIESGVFSINEVRDTLGKNPIKGGDKHYRGSALVDVDAPPPAAPAAPVPPQPSTDPTEPEGDEGTKPPEPEGDEGSGDATDPVVGG